MISILGTPGFGPPGRPAGRPSGFTLIEVMVALLLTGIVALTARALFGQVLVAAEGIARAREASTSIESRLWAEESCRGGEFGVPGTAGFKGTTMRATFTARLPGPEGWTERHEAVLAINSRTVTLMAGSIHATLADSITQGGFEYLAGAEGDGHWVAGWDSPVSAPVAIRIHWVRHAISDTLLCIIGERG